MKWIESSVIVIAVEDSWSAHYSLLYNCWVQSCNCLACLYANWRLHCGHIQRIYCYFSPFLCVVKLIWNVPRTTARTKVREVFNRHYFEQNQNIVLTYLKPLFWHFDVWTFGNYKITPNVTIERDYLLQIISRILFIPGI